MLKEKIQSANHNILLYGITPPKKVHGEEKLLSIAAKQIERISNLDIDGLIIYDIQDESERIDKERPFPFLPTLDSWEYSNTYLKKLHIPKIVYKCVGKYSKSELTQWLQKTRQTKSYAVFVGIATDDQMVKTSLPNAYNLKKQINPELVLGGVVIPERHKQLKDEHLRIESKIKQGCEFFVSQAVYDIQAAKDFLSEFFYFKCDKKIKAVPLIFTLTPCGSLKTLEFMEWLGINIPVWRKNELIHAENMLQTSIDNCLSIATELLDFSRPKNIPIGFNIESVSIRKEEIEASIALANDLGTLLKR